MIEHSTVYLKRVISIAHRLENRKKPSQWNKKIFGKCYEDTHGHNLLVEVWIIGIVDKETGMIINFNTIKEIIDKLDHHEISDMFEGLATAENISKKFASILLDRFENIISVRVRVWESDGAYAETFRIR